MVISYLSALGIGVIVFQFIGGHPLSWSVPGMAFIVLVAVGADYNMLLISRVRDESPHDVRAGVIKTVGTTGGVITSAGLIFAASMFGLLFGNISGMVQAGFIIGVGLLVDTFLVRTVTVPALAVLIGRANWWPTLWGSRAIPLDELDEFAVLTPTVAQATAFTTGGSPGSMRRAGTFPRVSEPGRWMRVHDWDEDVISAVMRESVVWSESDPLYRCHSGTASISRADSSW